MLFTDQTGYAFQLEKKPERIISLVPSQTELLYDLGLEEQIVGITKFCKYPKHLIKEKTIIGGTKNFLFKRIEDLKPDLIIGNKEENYLEGITELREKYPVWLSDIYTLEDAIDSIKSIGQLTRKERKSTQLIKDIKEEFQLLSVSSEKPRVLYLIWQKPYMAVGTNNFINEMINLMGFENCISAPRYPEISQEEINQLAPDYIFLSSEPYPFKKTNKEEFESLFPNTSIKLVDGELFSWFGSRLVQSPAYFKTLQKELSSI